MAARKLQQEVEKCFKKVAEGAAEFESIYEKLEQSSNAAQKEKLEDNLKREIKKLQRLRDQIKTWAASNDIKDKGPLLEQRRLIETLMEKFKAIEKAMKTKAYSKEGLSAAAKLDPKEQAKVEAGEFLAGMVDELEQQIETLEAESENLQATMKKGKGQGAKADRMVEIERFIERHKWHQAKLELIRRSLDNGAVEADQVTELEESIRYYVSDGMNDDFPEDDEMYNDLNLDEEEDVYGMNVENDKGSSQDTKSEMDDGDGEDKEGGAGSSNGSTKPVAAPVAPVATAAAAPVATAAVTPGAAPAAPGAAPAAPAAAPAAAAAPKPRSVIENALAGRRPSGAMKSPLPALATLHTPLPTISHVNTGSGGVAMKPAAAPARPAGEGMKWASAAAAAAANERNVGIAPLPPPPGLGPFPQVARSSAANSPALATVLPSHQMTGSPAPMMAKPATAVSAFQPALRTEPTRSTRSGPSSSGSSRAVAAPHPPTPAPARALPAAAVVATAEQLAEASTLHPASRPTNGLTNGTAKSAGTAAAEAEDDDHGQEQEDHRGADAGQHEDKGAYEDEDEDEDDDDEECIYHLPPCLSDLVESYEMSRKRPTAVTAPENMEMLAVSHRTCPTVDEMNTPRRYCPEVPVPVTGSDFPTEPLELLNDPRLYNRIDSDTLFYVFYYRQGTEQQYLAAKALKEQSWRFHKQYQTWFQRHEEPKNITDEFEQGTYRFFDYESTWMNRRKADFKFAYRYLEDEIEV